MTPNNDYNKGMNDFYNQRDIRCKIPLEMAFASNQHAVDFGQLVIQSSFLINGGAIIAVPAFVQAFSDTNPIDVETLYWSIACYFIGLIATWVSALFAYFSLVSSTNCFSESAVSIDCDLRIEHFPNDPSKESWENYSKEHKNKSDKSNRNCILLRSIAVIFSLISLAFFIRGSIIGTKAIIHDASVSIIQETSLSTPEPLTEVTNPVKEEKAPPIVEEKKEPPKNEK